MADNKIMNYSFASAGKNKYYASEVDEYLRSISESYDTMSRTYKANDKKMKSQAAALEEYKANKNAIVAAVVRAEKISDQIVSEANEHSSEILKKASEEAENYLLTKKAEADAYYYNVTHEADDRLKALEAEIEKSEKHAAALREKYLNKTNEKAAEIIENAKNKAAEIVAAAYEDAKLARQQSDEIIASTTAELKRLKDEIARYKKEIFSVVATIKPAVDSITADAEFDFAHTEVKIDSDDDVQDMPAFTLDMELDTEDEPAPAPEVQEYEDISSFTEPRANTFSDPVNNDNDDESDFEGMSFEDLDPEIFPEFKGGIFGDDGDEAPIDFSYNSDLDAFFDSPLD